MMRPILQFGFIIFIYFEVLCLLRYLPRIRAWFGTLRKQKRLTNAKNNKFAIIVPARNEAKVLGDLLASIKRQTYKNFDVYFVVQDHHDPAIEMVKEVNGIVHVVSEQTCKGDVLDYCLKSIIKGKIAYDACFIIDADCYMGDTCMEELNNAMASGKQIIQVKKKVKNFYMNSKKANTWASSCNGLIWTIIDDMGNRYKSDHNITGMLIGTGIMIRMDVIKEIDGWPYRQTLTEDIEFMSDCAVRGFSTFYYSYAEIYLEESTKLRVTNKRRSRWLNGVVASKRIYNERLKRLATRKNRYYVTGLSPVFYYIGGATVFGLTNIFLTPLFYFTGNYLWKITLYYVLFAFFLIYFSFFILTWVILMVGKIKRPFWQKIGLLFIHPIFYMGYIPIVAKALLGFGCKKWEIIERVDFAEVGHTK